MVVDPGVSEFEKGELEVVLSSYKCSRNWQEDERVIRPPMGGLADTRVETLFLFTFTESLSEKLE